MRSPRGDRRVLCTLRDALPVWDVGKAGLRVDCEIVRSRAPPLLAYVSQGSEGPQGGLTTVVTLVPIGELFRLSLDRTTCRQLFIARHAHTRKQESGAPHLTQYKPRRFQMFKPWIFTSPMATSTGGIRLGLFVVPNPIVRLLGSGSNATIHKFMHCCMCCETWSWDSISRLGVRSTAVEYIGDSRSYRV